MQWSLIFGYACAYGLAMSVLFSAGVLVGGALSRDFLLNDYPEAIQERYGKPRSERGRRVATWFGVLFWGGCALPLMVAAMLHLRSSLGSDLGFAGGAVVGAVMFTTLVLVDLVVLDWIVFAGLRPRIMVLPGTEGMPEYHDLAFHAVAALKGSPLIVVAGLVAGGAVAGIEAIA
ncbi:hypothetical protein ACIBO5_59395 [Nonomuraea angiospora]|uniref:hypothetical protein n=1 Tax=Nonomuraea angiospora TaxID=46172 RepID=UPI003793114A